MSSNLGSQTNRHTLRSLLIIVIILASHAARSETRPIVGHVLDLSGEWYLSMSAAGDAEPKPLSKWQDLPARAVVRIKSPSVYDYIRIVDQRLTVMIETFCRDLSKCAQPIYLPSSADKQPGNDPFAQVLRSIWKMLASGEYERSMHRVRDVAPVFFEAVAPLRDEKLNLADAMIGIGKGTYFLAPCKQEASCTDAGDRSTFLEFDWNPETPMSVEVSKNPTGLYEVTSRESGVQRGLALSLRILGCASKPYPSARDALARVKTMTDKWQETPEITHTFLRAYLTQLSKSGVCAG
jgi:hypothetical protein